MLNKLTKELPVYRPVKFMMTPGKVLRYHTKAELQNSSVVHHEDKFSDMITYLSSYASGGRFAHPGCVSSLKRYATYKGNVQSNGTFVLQWHDHVNNLWVITSVPVRKGDYQYTVLNIARNEQSDWITRKEVQKYLRVKPEVLREHLENGSVHPINGHLVQYITRYRNWSVLLEESITAPKVISTPRDTLVGIINDVTCGISQEETVTRLSELLHSMRDK